jgi:hypothetical protein
MLWDGEGSVVPGEGVLSKGAVGCDHFVEGGYAVAGRKGVDFGTNGMDGAGDVVAAIVGFVGPRDVS